MVVTNVWLNWYFLNFKTLCCDNLTVRQLFKVQKNLSSFNVLNWFRRIWTVQRNTGKISNFLSNQEIALWLNKIVFLSAELVKYLVKYWRFLRIAIFRLFRLFFRMNHRTDTELMIRKKNPRISETRKRFSKNPSSRAFDKSDNSDKSDKCVFQLVNQKSDSATSISRISFSSEGMVRHVLLQKPLFLLLNLSQNRHWLVPLFPIGLPPLCLGFNRTKTLKIFVRTHYFISWN